MKRLTCLALLILTGCELIVDVDMPRDSDKIVVHTFAEPDAPWKVELTASRYILEDLPFPPIVNAKVSIQDSDGSSVTLVQDPDVPGTYRASTRPVPGHHYKMNASAFGFATVEAELTIPTPVKLTRIFFDSANARTAVAPNGRSIEVPLEISFDDPADVDNYYDAYMIISSTVRTRMPNGTIEERPTAYKLRFILPEQNNDFVDQDYRPLFTDKTFAGSSRTLRTTVILNQSESNRLDRFEIRLISLSAEYYKYEDTKMTQQRSNGDPFAQPVQVFSNITNGHGVFSGSSYDGKAWDY